MNWTRLEGTSIWNEARAQYERDPRRHFHGWGHIERRYWHAEHTFAFPYDLDLDLAILTHDVIYDAAPEKELRSSKWLADHWDLPCIEAQGLVMSTTDHRLGPDNRMILVDLADMMDPVRRIADRELIRAESRALYGIDDMTFAHANSAFFEGMLGHYSEKNLARLPAWEAHFFREIRIGIRHIVSVAREELARA